MKNNRIKGFSIAGALLVVVLAALGYWIYYCLNPSRERVMAAMPKKYVIKRNREVLRFPVSFSCFEVLYQLFLFMQNKIVFGIW